MRDRRSLWLVVARELREATRRRSFWVIAAITLVGSTAAVLLPDLLGGTATSYTVGVVDGRAALHRALAHTGDPLDAKVEVRTLGSAGDARRQVRDGTVDVAVVAGDQPFVVARAGHAETAVAAVQQVVASQSLADRLVDAGLSSHQATSLVDHATVPVQRLDVDRESRRGAAVVVSLVLYLLLLMLTIQVANGVAIEKANRISEVLLAIVRPGALLFGKVIGVGTIGVLTLFAGVIPVLVKLGLGGSLPTGLVPAIAGGAPWALGGVALYLTLAGALGALVERQEEAGSTMAPLSVVLIGSYLVGQGAADSALGQLLAIVPLSSPLVMPSRIAAGAAAGWEIALSLVLLAASVVVAARLGATIYRRAIVHTGRKLKLREVLAGA